MTTVHLEQHGYDVCLGKPTTSSPRPDAIRMRDLLRPIDPTIVGALIAGAVPAGLPNVPPSGWGWGYTFGPEGWGMHANGPAQPGSDLPPDSVAYKRGAGDCWWAKCVNQIRMWAKLAGRPVPAFGDLGLLTQYSAYIASVNDGHGYDIQTGANDLGTDPLKAFDFLEEYPLTDDQGNEYPFGPIVSLTSGDVAELVVATKLFEGVGVGVQLQTAQVDQFDRGQPLAYVPGSPVEGGHELLAAGPDGMVEWSERIGYDPSFIEHNNDQSEATSSLEMFNQVTGDDAADATQVDVDKYVAILTGQTAS